MTHKWIRLVILLTCLLASMALKLHQIGAQSVWFDEGYSWNAAIQPSLIDSANADATNPPLYYMLLHAAVLGGGESEFTLRFLSLLFSMPLISIAYQLGKSLSLEKRRVSGGLFAAALTAFLPSLWWAAREARMYTLLALLVLMAALAWHRLITRPNRIAWGGLLLCELALLYAHNAAPVIVLWLNAVTLMLWITRRSIRIPDWRAWFAGQVIVGALWLPYFITRFLNLTSANSAISSAPQITPQFLFNVWSAFWIVPYERVVAAIDTPLIGIVLLIGAAALFVIVRRSRWMFVHGLVLTGGLIAALIVLGNEYHGRYSVMIAPLFMVAVGVGLAHMRRMGGVIVALLIGFSLWSIVSALDPALPYRHDDARGMVQYYADTLTDSDSVIAWSYADRYELAYYWDRLGVRANRITLPEGADMETIVPLLPTSGDIALNVWYTQRADYRGMMGCLLEDGTHAEPDTFTTYGMTTLTFHAPPLRQIGLNMQEGGYAFADEFGDAARLINFGGFPQGYTADQALCVPLSITLSRLFDGELKAAITLIHPIGGIVAQSDAIIATADGRTSESAPVGETLRAFPLVRLPIGAPPGAYQVYVRLYESPTHTSGYTPQGGVVRGRDLLLGTWQVQPGAIWQSPDPVWSDLAYTPIRESLRLGLLNRFEGGLQNGTTGIFRFVWEGEGDLPPLTLASSEDQWSFTLSMQSVDRVEGGMTLDWRRFTIPSDAPSGTAEIRLEDGRVIATVEIVSLPFVDTPPLIDHPISASIPDFADLLGYNSESVFSLDVPPELTLIWRAIGATPPLEGAIVFVQMLNADGQVIAQSDRQPAQGSRPTTGWRAGEIIVDPHVLEWNALAAPGEVTLIAGWYSAETGVRYPWADGTDSITLGRGEVR